MHKHNKLEQDMLDTYVLAIQEQLLRLYQQHTHEQKEMKTKESRKRLTAKEQALLQKIYDQTARANRNNVTRTTAYLRYYQAYQEIHWALLAHMVSRNGGWNMTDLKGGLLPRLLHPLEAAHFFQLLERCNWLIFQDAFPQLLLYAESKRRNTPLFNLLSNLNVSSFMQIIWLWYWEQRHQLSTQALSKLLTYALIINEQHYIEQRVLQNSFYQEHVLQRFTFLLQSFLHFNHVYFPYGEKGQELPVRLAGAIIEDFTDVRERIKVGKKLYALLFEQEKISEDIQRWVCQQSHTGTRADYWPHLFTADQGAQRRAGAYELHLHKGHLHPNTPPIYSPKLEQVWADVQHPRAEHGDWYQGERIHPWFAIEKNQPYEMTNESIFALNKIELAIVAKEFVGDP